jgi:hypothetical protein
METFSVLIVFEKFIFDTQLYISVLRLKEKREFLDSDRRQRKSWYALIPSIKKNS